MTLDFLSLNDTEADRLLKRLFGEPAAPQRAPVEPLPPLPRAPVARRIPSSSTTKPVELGDYVRMLDSDRVGRLTKLDGDQYLVWFAVFDWQWAGRGEFAA